ncbi:MAG: hypothetical protein U9R50_03310 [Campylobacterota bacterium]|nr:hypothetical protein [Campylobacterota bacterium]
MSVKKGLFVGFLFAFLVLGFVAMQRAMPEAKEDRIYKEIKVYSPYKLEKRVGGLTIIDSRSGNKEKPEAAEVLHRMDELDSKWGKKHLRVENNYLVVLGENNQSIVKIFIETTKEREWLQKFYGI